MQDPLLNRSLEETRELELRWSQFRDFLRLGMKGGEISSESEFMFLELKTRIAMLYDSLARSVTPDNGVAQNVIRVMASCFMLRRLRAMNPQQLHQLDTDWTAASVLISETIALLEQRQRELILVSDFSAGLKQYRQRVFSALGEFGRRPALFIPGLIILFALSLAFVSMTGIYDITRVKSDVPALRPLYNPVMAVARFAFSEIPYAAMDEVRPRKPDFAPPSPDAYSNPGKYRLSAKDFTVDLLNLGFDINDVDRATRILNRKRAFDAAIFTVTDGELREYIVLFATAADAKEFVRLRRAGLDKLTDNDRRYQIENSISVSRRANLVVLFRGSTSDNRRSFALKKWGFGPDQTDL